MERAHGRRVVDGDHSACPHLIYVQYNSGHCVIRVHYGTYLSERNTKWRRHWSAGQPGPIDNNAPPASPTTSVVCVYIVRGVVFFCERVLRIEAVFSTTHCVPPCRAWCVRRPPEWIICVFGGAARGRRPHTEQAVPCFSSPGRVYDADYGLRRHGYCCRLCRRRWCRCRRRHRRSSPVTQVRTQPYSLMVFDIIIIAGGMCRFVRRRWSSRWAIIIMIILSPSVHHDDMWRATGASSSRTNWPRLAARVLI